MRTECGIDSRDIKEFSKIAQELADLNERIQDYCPEASVFMLEDSLCLIVGKTDFREYHPMNDVKCVSSTYIKHADCGADNGLQYDESYDKYQFKGKTRIAKQTEKQQEEEALKCQYNGYCNCVHNPIPFEDFKAIYGNKWRKLK